jgi:hypothetical protein
MVQQEKSDLLNSQCKLYTECIPSFVQYHEQFAEANNDARHQDRAVSVST